MKLVIAITGATGAIYGTRLMEVLSATPDVETHLIISEAGDMTIKYETGRDVEEIRKMASFVYNTGDMGARISSGSFQRDGMIIAPCTIKTMSALANSLNYNLIIRAADVTLKERGKLVLMVRETPLHVGHLRSMATLFEMGATIMPPVPAFYHRPKTIMDIVDHSVGKVLDQFGIKHNLFNRWAGVN